MRDTRAMGREKEYFSRGPVRVWQRGVMAVVDVGRTRFEYRHRSIHRAYSTCTSLASGMRDAEGLDVNMRGWALDCIAHTNLPFRHCQMPGTHRFQWLRAALYAAVCELLTLARFGQAMHLLGSQLRWHRMDTTTKRFSLLDLS